MGNQNCRTDERREEAGEHSMLSPRAYCLSSESDFDEPTYTGKDAS
jgi:hypothetical protein